MAQKKNCKRYSYFIRLDIITTALAYVKAVNIITQFTWEKVLPGT